MSDARPAYLTPTDESAAYSTADYTRRVKRDRVEASRCVDCTAPAWVKPNGKTARKCRAHLDYDRDRLAGRRETAARSYVKLDPAPKTRGERRAAHRAANKCGCGRPRATADDGRLLKSCDGCRKKQRGRRRRAIFCVTCGAHGFHRADCEILLTLE